MSKYTIKWRDGDEYTGVAYCFEHGEESIDKRKDRGEQLHREVGGHSGWWETRVKRVYGGGATCSVCGKKLDGTHITVIGEEFTT